MSGFICKPVQNKLQGEIAIPGDKSISHRAIMFGSLAKGKTTIDNFLPGEDCLHTIDIFRHFGVNIQRDETKVTIESKGYEEFIEPKVPLYFGNSGTTARLMFGIIPALPFHSVMHGDPHLTIRPMDRVVNPLREMGASIDGRHGGSYLPIATRGKTLKGIHYELPVKSAQVKSAVLIAGLFAEGKTTVVENTTTRNHTENMLKSFGADLSIKGNDITITNKNKLQAHDITVPGDISSAAFFLVAAAIVPNSQVTLKNVGLNETRTGIIDVMKQMGADIDISNLRESGGEALGDITVTQTQLNGTEVSGDLIPRLIDEIPIIALLATQAKGKTIIKDAEELRVKETDRIKAVVHNLKALGASIEETDDGMIIDGSDHLTGGSVKSYSDHRIAMMNVIASMIANDEVKIDEIKSIAISYPNFFDHVMQIQ
ncbi:MAG TPA: 3-phosphoshikimate 1-carboxyvinyltransferase [Pseudogracilibacillus sp.]|nr:3-phosphoshikimate 1-carboxyvinyltransferase [Pseudogracilibacillus sp.]